ncbi:MAG: hypothetical protein OMM_04465 [Candidatus Magnetoglobus multicellularis str. Araruama]|uniref:HTH cro/C1-type domain-containing protein n=1 Tax=Candidatus Magnetoglobus multicellularis str. Araruama TaxID=890399 RepID=A0A1V1P1C0_9BACT|nr:MAG: hypothetical protein OMM_04465 [Candidatus Magnetoglobus multicellularis str. Araruama]
MKRTRKSVPPYAVVRSLKKLGSDIHSARLRRRIPSELLAERALISRSTLHKIEKGDPSLGGARPKANLLGLGAMTDSTLTTLFNLREYIRGWRFYNSFHINIDKIKKSVPTSQEPVLQEDAGNLSSVLFNLMTEHSDSFDELKSAIPGFKDLKRTRYQDLVEKWCMEVISEHSSSRLIVISFHL